MEKKVFTKTNSSRFLVGSHYLNMSKRKALYGCLGLLIFFGVAGPAAANRLYEVTVHNLTHGSQFEGEDCREGQLLGLFVFATHNNNVKLFELGETASPELALAAESGFPYPLADLLQADPNVGETVVVPNFSDISELSDILVGAICAGDQLTVTIEARRGHRFLSLAGMTAPTNDGFVALNRVRLPRDNSTVEYFSPVYDAGSEVNDEICANIPGLESVGIRGCPDGDLNTDPHFPGPDQNPDAGEGYVHIHSGIHGIGDLLPSIWDWRNPAAKITVRRIRQ